ncbi:DUF1320 domain-containing protein [Thalassobaculum sp.]|uniref:DUF1320 domain-containing protein n=1 Tax=Thalassobaculum sp. TaxID=2022740 RepID=UPI0032EBC97D
MGYVTKTDMIARYGEDQLIQLTDRTGAGTIDDAVLAAAIADADAEIDAHLQGRYRLPLAEVPKVLTRAAATIAYAELHTLEMPERVASTLTWARKLLARISRGEVQLGDADGDGAAPAVVSAGPAVSGGNSTFANGGLDDFTRGAS